MLAWLRLAFTLTLALFTPTALVSRAQATCVPPPFELLWSYPANGAKDVPIDARLWVLVSSASYASFSIEGRALTPDRTQGSFNSFSLDPGALQPNRAYKLVIEAKDHDVISGATRDKRVEIAFTTGSAQGTTPGYPNVNTAVTGAYSLGSTACPAILDTQDCYDTGPGSFVRFPTLGVETPPPAWLAGLEGGPAHLWPSNKCGAPTLRVLGDLNRCYVVRSVGLGGQLGQPWRHCIGGNPVELPSPPRILDAGLSDASAAEDAALSDASTSIEASASVDASTSADAAAASNGGAPPGPTGAPSQASSANAATPANDGEPDDERATSGCSAFPYARQTQSIGWWLLLALAITRLLSRLRDDRARTRRWAFAGAKRIYAMRAPRLRLPHRRKLIPAHR